MSDTRTCYFPNGLPAPGTVPCTSDEVSWCCSTDNFCLSNGYCMDVAQPYVLSRGACTSDSWATGCPSYCQEQEFETMGCSIINLSFYDGVSTYCCGTPVIDGDSIVCPYGYDAFQLPDATVLTGHALLANVSSLAAPSTSSAPNSSPSFTSGNTTTTASSSSSSSSSASTSHDVALGAGLGIPLGLIAVVSLFWAFWERKRANKLSKALMSAAASPGLESGGSPQSRLMNNSSGPSELSAKRPTNELMGREVREVSY
ncbi:hypothetical protein N7474_010917 [Penicillium riverlandense]|uniref:uncharacterized protein n=1 Tax=Penicillium riverlandense TaxID=1903569 RepID=UPI002548C9F3|nr:uncharacterized protein N7474_010917 [Penicillium riverlandense]KAJ5805030.1 hypothetical protein N7474_010917 [Penicillium riverlandense]